VKERRETHAEETPRSWSRCARTHVPKTADRLRRHVLRLLKRAGAEKFGSNYDCSCILACKRRQWVAGAEVHRHAMHRKAGIPRPGHSCPCRVAGPRLWPATIDQARQWHRIDVAW